MPRTSAPILGREITTPANPPANSRLLYPKADGWYQKTGGVETKLVDSSHTHTGYASDTHTHSGYAVSSHNHSGDYEPPILAATVPADKYWRGDKSWQILNKTAVGLGNVDNTSDASKPISSDTQTALNAKSALTHAAQHATGGADPITPASIGAVADSADAWHVVGAAGEQSYNGSPAWSGWTTAGCQYRKLPGGIVFIKIDANIPTNGHGTRIFTLPSAYRPAVDIDNHYMWHNSTGDRYCAVNVQSDGQVIWYNLGTPSGTRTTGHAIVPVG